VPEVIQLEIPVQDVAAVTYRRHTWQEAIADYLPPHRRTERAYRWINRLPSIVIVTVMSMLVMLLRNGAMIDEALYINAGNDYLHHLTQGTPTPDHGAVLSGAPVLYPILAALLNAAGGLWLVRLFSLACMIVAVFAVQRWTTNMTGSRRDGILAALAFAFTGPVIFLGAFATFDAVAVMLLAVGMALGTSYNRNLWTAVIAGLVLALAVATKYTAGVFVPVAVAVILLAVPYAWKRAAVVAGSCVATLGVAYLLWGDTVAGGLKFTTTQREALAPTDPSVLVALLMLNLLLLFLLALWGGFRYLYPKGQGRAKHRSALLVPVILIGAGLALPVAQISIGEGVSFTKHTAYSALFLAPLAGVALASISRGMLKLGPIIGLSVLIIFVGYGRSQAMYTEWVDVKPALTMIEYNPKPGLYVSSSADVLKYYTAGEHPQIDWETTFVLYYGGEQAIKEAIETGKYQMVLLRNSSTGNPEQDTAQATLLNALAASDKYELVTDSLPVGGYRAENWVIYEKATQ
jgi:hypothetical protein